MFGITRINLQLWWWNRLVLSTFHAFMHQQVGLPYIYTGHLCNCESLKYEIWSYIWVACCLYMEFLLSSYRKFCRNINPFYFQHFFNREHLLYMQFGVVYFVYNVIEYLYMQKYLTMNINKRNRNNKVSNSTSPTTYELIIKCPQVSMLSTESTLRWQHDLMYKLHNAIEVYHFSRIQVLWTKCAKLSHWMCIEKVYNVLLNIFITIRICPPYIIECHETLLHKW